MNSNQISKAVRYALVAGAVGATATPAAFAADATTDQTMAANQNSTAQLGKIEVTGTRIKRTDVETAQPVTMLTAAQIKSTGLTSIGDILQTVSQAGAALNTTFNNGGNGRTNIDLRNLGANRVLVLVNGRRWITGLGGPGQNGVDLNQIPVAVIDHVEILQDGASAIYGSDAIAGVVNIITIKNYNGAEANAYTSIYAGEGHHDGKVQEYDFTLGSSSDKSSVTMNVAYVNQHEVWAGARAMSKEPVWGEGARTGSSGTPQGRFITAPFNGACPGKASLTSYGSCDMTLSQTPKPGKAGAANGPSLANFRNRLGTDIYNFAPLNYFVTPNERTSFYAQGHYDITDNLTFSSEVVFNKRNSQQALAPSPLFLGSTKQISANGQGIGVGAANPYNPFGHDLVGNTSQWCVAQGNCATNPNDLLIFLGRRPLEAGQRLFSQNVETMQFAGGFKGYFNLGGNEWDWDTSYVYGNNYDSDSTNGLFNTERLAVALDSPGFASCASQPGCVPFNIFGGANSITPAMLNYVLYEDHSIIQVTQRDYTANLNGSIMDLPAGPLGMALGYEYLEQDGFFHPDATTASGNTSGSAAQPTDGRTKTDAEYVEFDIPLVADAPGFKMLDLDVANRWSKFKWFGGTPGTPVSDVVHSASASTARAALKWQPTDALLLRASWSQGFRAPAISELFLGAGDSFPTVSDPCAKAPGSWDGVAAHYPAGCPRGSNGAPTPHTQPLSQIRTVVGGNPNLSPEQALSRAVGFVYNPDWMPGFDFSADYYKIEVNHLIAPIAPQTLLNGCFKFSNPASCSKVTLTGNKVSLITDFNVNIGGIRTSGVDVAAHYKFPSTAMGDFKAGLDVTFLKSIVQTLPTGALPPAASFTNTELGGTADSVTAFGGFPRRRANANLAWNYGDWSAMWNAELIGAMYEGCSSVTLGAYPSQCSDPTETNFNGATGRNHIGTTVYHDVQGTYHVGDWNTDLSFGIRNLFEKNPPASLTAFANSFLPAFYRVPGRQFYARVSMKF